MGVKAREDVHEAVGAPDIGGGAVVHLACLVDLHVTGALL